MDGGASDGWSGDTRGVRWRLLLRRRANLDTARCRSGIDGVVVLVVGLLVVARH